MAGGWGHALASLQAKGIPVNKEDGRGGGGGGAKVPLTSRFVATSILESADGGNTFKESKRIQNEHEEGVKRNRDLEILDARQSGQ